MKILVYGHSSLANLIRQFLARCADMGECHVVSCYTHYDILSHLNESCIVVLDLTMRSREAITLATIIGTTKTIVMGSSRHEESVAAAMDLAFAKTHDQLYAQLLSIAPPTAVAA